MTKIITATGKEFDAGLVAEHLESNSLYICISNADKETAEKVFSDPSETAVLYYSNGQIEGFTSLVSIDSINNGVKVKLRHG